MLGNIFVLYVCFKFGSNFKRNIDKIGYFLKDRLIFEILIVSGCLNN